MIYPSLRDWLFSVKTFAASMLALYLALIFQLPRPYWAMATVYIVSNPFVGATRSKALYRALGTALGAAAAVLLVPPFVETPLILSVLVATWTGTLLYLAITDRTARSYVFMLAGYTMPMIALPAVSDPGTVFDVAIARTEEITLGIICASLVGSSILPGRLAPTLIERADAWFRDAAFYCREMLSGNLSGEAISACRQRMASAINQFEFLLSQLGYDDAHPETVARAQDLRGRMQLFLLMIPALADPLSAMFRDAHVRPAGLDALLADVVRWFDDLRSSPDADMPDDGSDPVAGDLRARIAILQPAADSLAHWEDALLSNALWRLRQVIDVWQDCCSLRAQVVHPRRAWRPRFRHWRLGGTDRFYDRGMMLFSCFLPVSAILVACWLWIGSGWHDGAGAVTLVAVSCCFFAPLDEPAPMVFRMFVATVASLLLAGLYLFVVLPTVHDFPILVLLFAGPFILIGTLIPRPQFNMVTMIVAANLATYISIQGAYDTDFLAFVNGNVAGVAGLLFAYIWTRITRPFGVEFAVRRLLRSSWVDVARSAAPGPLVDPRNLTSRMLDRLMQLVPRLRSLDGQTHPATDSFRDLRVALNSLDLRRLHRKLDGELPTAIDRVLVGLANYYMRCANGSERQHAPLALLETLDDALHCVTARGTGHAGEGGASSVEAPMDGVSAPRIRTSQRSLRDALHALVGLRLSLFPASAGPRPTDDVPDTRA
ncbi:FUSC family protein [Paraburkholderia sp.]|uniref:FUSC family protein n=1 Tax=Paraburkholderia sp. TaxID=1926495 RepID=UPI0023864144|nr:FUSC family protein [Paraburkholderia sp.]MDE1180027.1 FUSC family protein [Paraburkholderia sp.]